MPAKAVKDLYAVGDKVFVKWMNDKNWFAAKVSDPSLKNKVEVEFEDGTVGDFPLTRIASHQRMTRKSKSRSRSRGRTRSRSRGRSPGRPQNKAKKSPSPARKTASKKVPKTPTTPTRQSSRLVEKIVTEEPVADEKPVKQASSRREGKAAANSDTPAASKSSEFGGVFGTAVLTLLLPAVILTISILAAKGWRLSVPVFPRRLSAYFDRDAALIVLGWVALQLVLAVLPVGRMLDGQPLKSGQKLKYRCNGFFAFVVSIGLFLVLTLHFKVSVSLVYNKLFEMAVAAITFSLLLSVLLYLRARKAPAAALSEAGSSGNVIYDFFMGRELNPRCGPVDIKFFCELRPGMIGWVLLNLVFVAQDCAANGGSPNKALLMVTAFQAWYVGEALWFEDAILTTMDITHDGFGYMLALGDLAWVPFLYSLQGRYLLAVRPEWSNVALAGFVLLNLIGYAIFRGSNSQKNKFRTNPYDPSLAHLETLPTPAGKKLLVSGWWGLCRHPNYLGDLIMATAWSLPCGFTHALPYFYPVYFLLLLVDRARRDDVMCRRKYGAAWDRYCQRVKYRIFPYVY